MQEKVLLAIGISVGKRTFGQRTSEEPHPNFRNEPKDENPSSWLTVWIGIRLVGNREVPPKSKHVECQVDILCNQWLAMMDLGAYANLCTPNSTEFPNFGNAFADRNSPQARPAGG
jgi:hypothetical protein